MVERASMLLSSSTKAEGTTALRAEQNAGEDPGVKFKELFHELVRARGTAVAAELAPVPLTRIETPPITEAMETEEAAVAVEQESVTEEELQTAIGMTKDEIREEKFEKEQPQEQEPQQELVPEQGQGEVPVIARTEKQERSLPVQWAKQEAFVPDEGEKAAVVKVLKEVMKPHAPVDAQAVEQEQLTDTDVRPSTAVFQGKAQEAAVTEEMKVGESQAQEATLPAFTEEVTAEIEKESRVQRTKSSELRPEEQSVEPTVAKLNVAAEIVASQNKSPAEGAAVNVQHLAALAPVQNARRVEPALQRQPISPVLEKLGKESPSANLTPLVEKRAAKEVTGKEKPASSQQAKLMEQIQKIMDEALKMKDGNTLTMRLEPAELGTIVLKVTQRGEEVFARIIPESREVEAALRANMSEVMHSLAHVGVKAENVHVVVGHDLSPTQFLRFGEPQGDHQAGQRSAHPERQLAQNEQREDSLTDNGWKAETSGWVA